MMIHDKKKTAFLCRTAVFNSRIQCNGFAKTRAFSFFLTPRRRIYFRVLLELDARASGILGNDSANDGAEDGGRRDLTRRMRIARRASAVSVVAALALQARLISVSFALRDLRLRSVVVARSCSMRGGSVRREEASAGTASVVLSTPKLMMPARTAAMLFFQFNFIMIISSFLYGVCFPFDDGSIAARFCSPLK